MANPSPESTKPGTQASAEATVSAIHKPMTPQHDDEMIAKLAAMKPLEYERVRIEQATQMGCRPPILDKLWDADLPS